MSATDDLNGLMGASNCLQSCVPPGMHDAIQTYLLDQIRNTLTAGWDDLVFPANTLNPPGPVGAGDVVGNSGPPFPGGIYLALELGAAEAFWIEVQMPHTWVQGTRVYPHIHVVPQTNNVNNLSLSIYYDIATIGGTYAGNSVPVVQAHTIPANSQGKHIMLLLPDGGVDMSAYADESAIIRSRITITAATEPIHIISFDVHYFKNISPVQDFDPTLNVE